MKNLFKLNWINGLGLSFLFTGFLYFLKLAVDSGWLPPSVRAASGILLGVGLLFSGLAFFKRGKNVVAELMSGSGIAVLYATLAYISFSSSFTWSPNALLISMVAISLVSSVVAIKFDMRVLYILSILGGLITPLIIKATESQDFMLFIYILIINVAALYVSAVKKWSELKVISFVLSTALYASYYLLFDPLFWGKPFFYISALFVVYMVGLTISSWFQNKNEFGVDQFLGIANAIGFVFWSTLIFNSFNVAHIVPMLIVGLVFLGLGALFYFYKGKQISVVNGVYLALGVLVMAIACSDTGMVLKHGLNYVVNSLVWLILIAVVFFFGKYSKQRFLMLGAYVAFLILSIYWYKFAWNVEWITMFGIKYVPFINAGAFIWMAMAFIGFYFSKFEEKNIVEENEHQEDRNAVSLALGALSHVIVGGLLTVQIANLWKAYDIQLVSKGLAMSVTWMVYALLLFLWSKGSRNKLYKYMGITVLVLTSLKVFIFDLSGSATIQKVIFLMIVGALTLVIGKVSKPSTVEE
jgi:uncharacterized membrane protein